MGPYGAIAKIKLGSTLFFLSGLCSRDAKTGEVEVGKIGGKGDLEVQTIRTMERIKAALASVRTSMDDIFYLHVWLDATVSIEDKEKIVDPSFGKYFNGRVPPCNVVMGIKRCYMPKGDANLEIEAWAAIADS